MSSPSEDHPGAPAANVPYLRLVPSAEEAGPAGNIESGDPFARALVTGLSAVRLLAAKPVYDHIVNTPPENRGWGFASTVAAIEATDFEDGLLSRLLKVQSKRGGLLDTFADKVFVTSAMLALNKTGELPPSHTAIKVARDIAISGIRLRAARKHPGIDISAKMPGKIKAAAEMLAVEAAASPVSANPDVIRSLASAATALQITSLAYYVEKYISAGKEGSKTLETSTQNSRLRDLFAELIDHVTEHICTNHPDIDPDLITKAGTALVIASGLYVLAQKDEKNTLGPVMLYIAGCLADALDGNLARKKSKKEGTKTTIKGELLDVTADKLAEIVIACLVLAPLALRRGNKVAAINYALAGMTTSLPALLRARAEMKGYIAAEAGIGTRPARAALAGAGIAFNKSQDASNIISALLAISSVATTLERLDLVRKGKGSEHLKGILSDPEAIEAAGIRFKRIEKLAVMGGALGLASLVHTLRKSPTLKEASDG